MTNYSSDPRDPNRDILRKTDNSVGVGTMVVIAAAVVVAMGTAWYVLSDNRNVASTNPPSTVGQTETTRPAPLPVNPAPAPSPAPAPQAQ